MAICFHMAEWLIYWLASFFSVFCLLKSRLVISSELFYLEKPCIASPRVTISVGLCPFSSFKRELVSLQLLFFDFTWLVWRLWVFSSCFVLFYYYYYYFIFFSLVGYPSEIRECCHRQRVRLRVRGLGFWLPRICTAQPGGYLGPASRSATTFHRKIAAVSTSLSKGNCVWFSCFF